MLQAPLAGAEAAPSDLHRGGPGASATGGGLIGASTFSHVLEPRDQPPRGRGVGGDCAGDLERRVAGQTAAVLVVDVERLHREPRAAAFSPPERLRSAATGGGSWFRVSAGIHRVAMVITRFPGVPGVSTPTHGTPTSPAGSPSR